MTKKGLKYYLFIFAMATLAIFIYLMINSFGGNELTISYVFSIITVPFMFTLFLFLFDRIIGFFFSKKKDTDENLYDKFLVRSTEILKETGEYDIEDFKRFRNNEKFQRSLNIMYKIEKNGESDDANYKMIEKRFKKDTKEYKAIHLLKSKK